VKTTVKANVIQRSRSLQQQPDNSLPTSSQAGKNNKQTFIYSRNSLLEI